MKYLMLLALFALCGCSSFFYYPTQEEYYDPGRAGLVPENVDIKSAGGDTIHAWWFDAKQKPSKGTIVFFHGNAQNLTAHFAFLAWAPMAGYSFLIFDYPGYGNSPGAPTPRNTVEAGTAAVEWVHANKDPRPLIIYGQSLGGIVALRTVLDLQRKIPLEAVIADSTFPSYEKIAVRKLSEVWLTWPFQWLGYLLLSDRYAPKKIADIAPTPLVVIHGQQDRAVEPEFGEQIYALAAEPKQIWRIPDGVHGSSMYGHDFVYRKKLLEFLEPLNEPAKKPNPASRRSLPAGK